MNCTRAAPPPVLVRLHLTRLVPGGEYDSKPCLAAHHPLVGLSCPLQREDLITLDRTPLCTLKARVSCASIDVPEYQPTTDLRPEMSRNGDTSSASGEPRTTNFPRTPNPPRTAPIASPLVTVARITLALPKLTSSAAGSCT